MRAVAPIFCLVIASAMIQTKPDQPEASPGPLMRSFGAPPAARRVRQGWLLVATVAAVFLFTAAVIQESMTQGRLTFPATFDDVTYLLDGARRAGVLYTHGLGEVVRGYVRQPPHSPVATFMAAAGFLLFGMNEWAPYAMNSLVVLAMWGLALWLLRGRPAWQRVPCVLALATIPMVIMAVHEFRPDIPSAVLISAGVLALLDNPAPERSGRRALFAGGLFGLAILCKPASFPATLVAMTGAVVLRGWLVAGLNVRAWRGEARRALPVVLGALVVAGPHMALDGVRVWRYIRFNMAGPGKSLWSSEMSFWAHLRYYIDGPGGQFMLGRFAYPLLALAAIGAAVLVWGRRWEEARRRAALLVMLVGLYLVSTLTPVKQVFFGSPFQMLLIMTGVLSVGSVLEGFARAGRARWAGALVCGILAVASLWTFRWPNAWGPRMRPLAVAARQAAADLSGAIGRSADGRQVRAFMTFTGHISGPALELECMRSGTRVVSVSREMATTIEQCAGDLAWADMVVAVDSGSGLAAERFPSAKIMDDMRLWLDRRPEWERVATIPVYGKQKSLYVYRKRAAAGG